MKNLCCRRSWKNVLINRIENDYFFKKYLFIIIISLIFIKFLLFMFFKTNLEKIIFKTFGKNKKI